MGGRLIGEGVLMANRTLAHAYLAVVVASGLSLGCDRPPAQPSPPPTPGALAVTSLSPASGSIYGGTTITILGTGFDSHVALLFDGRPFHAIRATSTMISFEAPAHAAGLVAVVVANGDGQTATAPAYTYRAAPRHIFTDAATGFATSDLRDAQDHVVRIDADGYLIWGETGTALGGFSVRGMTINMSADHACACTLEVRFGTENGERRAYLTADYGHSDLGTMVDLALAGNTLTVSRSVRYPPGTYTLSGVVSEATPAGPVALEGVSVFLGFGTGWRSGVTDQNGMYQIHGLDDGAATLEIQALAYETVRRGVSINGNTRFDVQLIRR
jgi:hypothetical protein